MASVTALRNGIATRLEAISGLRVHARAVEAIALPAATVRRSAIAYDSTFARGSDDMTFVVTLYVSAADFDRAQRELDDYLAGSGAKSVKAVIEADQTLGGVANFARVVSAGEDGLTNYAGQQCLAVDFIIGVTADGEV